VQHTVWHFAKRGQLSAASEAFLTIGLNGAKKAGPIGPAGMESSLLPN
jgi:hypothetical protein